MRIGLNSPQALLALLIRRRWWIIAPFVALTCLVVVLSRNLPKTFVSESMVQIQPRDVTDKFVPDLIAGSVNERVKSIEQTVMSRTNILAIIREFDDQMPDLDSLNMDEKVDRIRGKIGINYPPIPRSNLQLAIPYFRISYAHQNRQLAQQIAQKLTQLFITENNRQREDQVDGTRTFLSGELTRVGDSLRVVEEQVKQMKMAHLGELPEKLDANQRMVEGLLQKALSIDDGLMKNAAQRQNYELLLKDTPPAIPLRGFIAPAANNPNAVLAGLVKPPAESQAVLDFRKADQAYLDITAIYPPGNPDVIRAKVVRDRYHARLTPEELEIASKPPIALATAALPATSATGSTTPVTIPTETNPMYTQLMLSINNTETERLSLQKQKSDTATSIELYTRRIENTPQVETDMADLLRERESLQNQYDGIKKNLSQAELSASLESQAKGHRFQIIDPANLPVEPITPRRMFIAMGGSAAALALSLLFAVAVDIARQRVWTQNEIETFWGVPVLVAIPEILTDSDVSLAKRKKWIFAASAAGASVVYSVCLYAVHLNNAFILRQLDPVLQKLIN